MADPDPYTAGFKQAQERARMVAATRHRGPDAANVIRDMVVIPRADFEASPFFDGEPGADAAGIAFGELDHHGEMELHLDVNGEKGSVFLSKEMWEQAGRNAGWLPS
jgi:hypothetical protein